MKIQVCIDKNDKNQKNRGDLLEKLSKEFLEGLDYNVETEVKKTGMELDLLCKANANPAKKIYVECKAYQTDNKIQADVIKNLVGIRELENYEEVWLITLSELGKEAKGLKEKIQSSKKSKFFTFYTPKEFLEALENNRLICNVEIPKSEIKKLIKTENEIGESSLLITEYDYFWAIEHKKGGKPCNVFVAYAKSGELVKDDELLSNLQNLYSSYSNLNFKAIIQINNSADLTMNKLELNQNYLNSINKLGIQLTHPHKNEIFINDIFCWQDLQKIQSINDDVVVSMSSEKLQNVFKLETKKYIIFGEEVSGKTTLLNMLQMTFNKKGLFALSINAKDIRTQEYKRFEKVLLEHFKKQYDENYITFFNLLLKNKAKDMVLLIDDFENLGVKSNKTKMEAMKMLNDNFTNIIIFSDDSMEIEVMTKESIRIQLNGFDFYKIKEYGHKLRDTMIEKWINLGLESDIEDNDLFEKKDAITQTMNTIIGTKFIPTYPFYVVILLQQIESGINFNLGGSAYAEFYNYIINESMSKTNVKPNELDFYHTYLSFVAYNFFVKGIKELDRECMEEIHKIYSQKYHKRNFDDIYNNLIKARLIKKTNNTYSFGQNYIYYFYVAKYLSDNVERDKNISKQVDMLIERLYRVEFANIIIFFIHHSKARAESIIDKIIQKAQNIFDNIKPTSLNREELLKINSLISEGLKVTMSSQQPQNYRQTELEAKDTFSNMQSEEKSDVVAKYDEEIIDLDIFAKTNLSMKLMEIMGQIAKNYYGSLPKNEKELLLSETIALGLTNLNFFIRQISEYKDMLIQEIEELNNKRADTQTYNKELNAQKTIFAFAIMLCFGFVKKISSSISSEYLVEEIKNIRDNEAILLIKNAINLETTKKFNKCQIISMYEKFDEDKNLLLRELLKICVMEHLYKFDVKYDLKQSICQKMGIGMEKVLIKKSKDKN